MNNALQVVNLSLEQGIDLPTYEGMRFDDSQISAHDGYAEVEANILKANSTKSIKKDFNHIP